MELKEGQTYICTESDVSYWTVGKEYPVINTTYDELVLRDDEGDVWYAPLGSSMAKFKLKEDYVTEKYGETEPIFDLNKLTLNELLEYVELAQDAQDAGDRLEQFIADKKKYM